MRDEGLSASTRFRQAICLLGTTAKGSWKRCPSLTTGSTTTFKADFLGYSREIHGVQNVECMPLSEKWVVTISTQYGCPMKCTFCDVPNVKFKGNANFRRSEVATLQRNLAVPNCQIHGASKHPLRKNGRPNLQQRCLQVFSVVGRKQKATPRRDGASCRGVASSSNNVASKKVHET